VAGSGVMLPTRPGLLAEPPGSAVERRAYFLLLRQKKVAKEKATPGYAVGYADFPALLEAGGGCGTRPCGPRTVLALFPPASALLGAAHGDPKSNTSRADRHSRESGSPVSCMDSRLRGNDRATVSPRVVFPGPLRGAEQRRSAGGSRLALSEPQASLASRPAFRVAQGTGRSPAPTQGWPFLWLLSFGHTKESTPASKAEPQANRSRKGGPHRESNPTHQHPSNN
jgi:hypothetical protein